MQKVFEKIKIWWDLLFGLNTLYGKVALVFWILITSLGLTMYYLLDIYWNDARSEYQQRLHWNIAEHFAEELRPLLRANPLDATVKEKLALWSLRFPEFNIYVLNKNGEQHFTFPLYQHGRSSRSTGKFVDLKPLKKFLSLDPSRQIPIFGQDPRNTKNLVTFSAAEVHLKDQPGYIYVVLQGYAAESLSNGIEDRRAIFGGIIGFAALVLFTAILGSIMFFYVTKRFRALRQAVGNFSAGDLSARAAVGGDDEISQFALEVNQMADTIVANIDELHESDRLRREMVANIAHDLGGPLTLALGYIDRATSAFGTMPSDTVAALGDAAKNLEALRRLTGDLFQLSKLDAGDIAPHFEPFSLLDLLTEEILPKTQKRADQRNIQIDLQHGDSSALVTADIGMIDRVLTNLIENAIRYNKEQGLITVRIIEGEKKVRCEIEDTGIGIPEKHLDRIFERSYVVDKARTRGVGGSGLGLSIVAQMLDLHSEKIEAKSIEGERTIFAFELPAGIQ